MKMFLLIIVFTLNGLAASPLREGVWTPQTMAEVQDLFQWIQTSKVLLEDGLKDIDKKDLKVRRAEYLKLIESVVSLSGKKEAELLMRIVLNRALTIDEFLIETAKNSPQFDTVARRFLKESIVLAIQVYKEDENFLKGLTAKNIGSGLSSETVASLALFEVQYAMSLKEKARTAPTHAGTFTLLKFALDMFRGGLNHAQIRRQFAAPIVKATQIATALPSKLSEDPVEAIRTNLNLKSDLDLVVEMASKVEFLRLGLPEKLGPYYWGSGAAKMVTATEAEIFCKAIGGRLPDITDVLRDLGMTYRNTPAKGYKELSKFLDLYIVDDAPVRVEVPQPRIWLSNTYRGRNLYYNYNSHIYVDYTAHDISNAVRCMSR